MKDKGGGRKFILHPSSFSLSVLSVPVQNLFPRPEKNMLLLLQVSKGLLEVLDPMRHSADVRVDRNRHDSGAVRSFSVERLELILGSAKKFLRFMVLENHHRDVVQLYRIRERNERAMRRFDLVGLIIVDPVGDIVKAGFGQEIESLFSFCEPWTKPSRRCLARELADDFHGLPDRLPLIF